MAFNRRVFVSAASLLLSHYAYADKYPDHPIRVVVPFTAGGSVDVVARIVGDPLSRILNTPVVVDNKAGASGMIGSKMVADAKPDGYTLLANSSIHVIVPSLYKKTNYDAIQDFEPISQITSVPLVLLASPNAPFADLKSLVAWGKKQAEGVSYASAGNGSSTHLAGEMLGEVLGMKVVHVPYKGSGSAMTDVMAGQVPVMFDALTAVMGHIKSGKLKAIAVAAPQRIPTLPGIPTFAEQGFSQFELSTWHGFWAPKGTPKPIINMLSSELQKITNTPAVQERILSLGGQPVGNTPEEFDKFQKAEYKKWGDLVKRYNATLD